MLLWFLKSKQAEHVQPQPYRPKPAGEYSLLHSSTRSLFSVKRKGKSWLAYGRENISKREK